ncbi:hypothetical protein J5N97_004981 [Dioscorea zingiberensis]|uniref:CST complex subunit CTC1 n=1 Tax=Dioscorea zingiberensis TaxID=325984 RepID=A0A9D5HRE9_9LILI|nr:hypothetical protein J5N97_004981 [Dioscorea zingiberensis]
MVFLSKAVPVLLGSSMACWKAVSPVFMVSSRSLGIGFRILAEWLGFLPIYLPASLKLVVIVPSVDDVQHLLEQQSIHSFTQQTFLYFVKPTSLWQPVMAKLIGKLILVSGLKKKMVEVGVHSYLMFVATEKTMVSLCQIPFNNMESRVVRPVMNGESVYCGVVTGVYMHGMAVELDNKVWLMITDPLLGPQHSLRVGALHGVFMEFCKNAAFRSEYNLLPFKLFSSSTGRLQLIDATGKVDAVVSDLRSEINVENIYEVKDYKIVLEGLPTQIYPLRFNLDGPLSCKNIFQRFPYGEVPTGLAIYVHFSLMNSTGVNVPLSCLARVDDQFAPKNNSEDIECLLARFLVHLLFTSANYQVSVVSGYIRNSEGNPWGHMTDAKGFTRILLDIKSDCYHKYQFLRIGGFYIIKCSEEHLGCGLQGCHDFKSGKVLVTSYSTLWSLSFSLDDTPNLGESTLDCSPGFSSVGVDKTFQEIQHPNEISFQQSGSLMLENSDVLLSFTSEETRPVNKGRSKVQDGFIRCLELVLTPVSFVEINSIWEVDCEEIRGRLISQSSLEVSEKESLNIASFGLTLDMVVGIHILVLEESIPCSVKSQSMSALKLPTVNIPLAGVVVDDGSSLRCCWVNAGKADVLLRLGEAFRTFFCRHGKSLMIGSKNFREYCGQCHGFNWSSAVEVSPSGTAVTIAADGKYMD